MASIKFFRNCKKIQDQHGHPVNSAKLLLALSIPMEAISHAIDFLNYDTDHGKDEIKFDTLYLLLLFQKPDGSVFTSVRQQWHYKYGNKLPYFESLLGQQFNIIVENP